MSLLDLKFQVRPPTLTNQRETFSTNYFSLNPQNNLKLYRYRISAKVRVVKTKFNKSAIKSSGDSSAKVSAKGPESKSATTSSVYNSAKVPGKGSQKGSAKSPEKGSETSSAKSSGDNTPGNNEIDSSLDPLSTTETTDEIAGALRRRMILIFLDQLEHQGREYTTPRQAPSSDSAAEADPSSGVVTDQGKASDQESSSKSPSKQVSAERESIIQSKKAGSTTPLAMRGSKSQQTTPEHQRSESNSSKANLGPKGVMAASNMTDVIVTRQPLHVVNGEAWNETVEMYSESQSLTSTNLPKYTFTLTHESNIDVQQMLNDVRRPIGTQFPPNYFDQILDTLNIIASHAAHRKTRRIAGPPLPDTEPSVANVGANKFYLFEARRDGHPRMPLQPNTFPNTNDANPYWKISDLNRYDDPSTIMAHLGFFRSVRAIQGKNFLLNVNAITGCFYQAIRMDQMLLGINANKPWSVLDSFISGLRVQTSYKYRGFQREVYLTVTGLALMPGQPSDSKFCEWPGNGLGPIASKVTFITKDTPPKTRTVLDYWKNGK